MASKLTLANFGASGAATAATATGAAGVCSIIWTAGCSTLAVGSGTPLVGIWPPVRACPFCWNRANKLLILLPVGFRTLTTATAGAAGAATGAAAGAGAA